MEVKTYEYTLKCGDHTVGWLGIVMNTEGKMGCGFTYSKDSFTQIGNLNKAENRRWSEDSPELFVEFTDGEPWEPDCLHLQYNDRQVRNGTGMRLELTGIFK